MKVGDTIWDSTGTAYEIKSETSRSWLVWKFEWAKLKVPKRYIPENDYWPRWFFDKDHMDRVLFARKHRYAISKAVERLDGAMMFKVAELIGWTPEAKP